jgi:hypothetical protein
LRHDRRLGDGGNHRRTCDTQTRRPDNRRARSHFDGGWAHLLALSVGVWNSFALVIVGMIVGEGGLSVGSVALTIMATSQPR